MTAQNVRCDRAAILTAVVRTVFDTGLNAPASTNFRSDDTDGMWLSLTFDSAEDAQAWTKHLGGNGNGHIYKPDWHDTPIYTYSGSVRPGLGVAYVQITGWTSVAEDSPAAVVPSANTNAGSAVTQ